MRSHFNDWAFLFHWIQTEREAEKLAEMRMMLEEIALLEEEFEFMMMCCDDCADYEVAGVGQDLLRRHQGANTCPPAQCIEM